MANRKVTSDSSDSVIAAAVLASFPLNKADRILEAHATDHDKVVVKGSNLIPLRIGTSWFLIDTDTNLSTATHMDTGSVSNGKDYCVYACDNAGTLAFLISLATTFPAGYDANTSRKIGGFHTLCANVGTIASHTLTGYVANDILPASIWDLKHRPLSEPAGMVFSGAANIWVDIYLASGTGASTVSAFRGTISDTRNWMDFNDDFGSVRKKMLDDIEFQLIAAGSNEQTNIAGSSDPVSTGGHRDTTGTSGTSTSAGSPSTDISGVTNPASLTVALNGTTATVVSFNPTGLNSGALIAAALQVAIRAAFPWAVGLTVTYGATYVITSPGSYGTAASVVVTNGTPNDCAAALKLGVANGGTEVVGTLGRRMISNIGCEDCCGALWQWLRDYGYQYQADVAPTYTTSAKTVAATHAASPGGNPIYLKYSVSGDPYLCCNMATDTADKILTFGSSFTVRVTHDADAATGSYQVYFDEDATQPFRLLAILPGLKNEYLRSSDPTNFLPIKYSATANSLGVALYFYDGADERLEFISPTTANGTIDLGYVSAPAWSYQTLTPKGQIYKQGTYGDVRLLAGAYWNKGTYSGSRSRYAVSYRWYTYSSIGSRGRSEPR